jgi:hypothetical protein
MASTRSLASPKSIWVFSRKNSGFCTPGGPAFGACGVDGHVESAEAFNRRRDQFCDLVFEPDVRLHEFGFGAQRTQVANDLSARFGAAAGDDDAIAAAGERFGDGLTDAAQGSGDDHTPGVGHGSSWRERAVGRAVQADASTAASAPSTRCVRSRRS